MSNQLGSTLLVIVGIVALIVLWLWQRHHARQESQSFVHPPTPPRRSMSTVPPPNTRSSVVESPEPTPFPAEPVAAEPAPDPEPETPSPTPAELVAKHWPSDGQSNMGRAITVLSAVKDECDVDWDDDVSYQDPTPSDFVAPLQERGCTTADLLAAFYEETGLRLGSIMTDIMSDVTVTTDDLIAAMRQGNIDLDADELSSLLDVEEVDDAEIFKIARGLGLTCPALIEVYQDSSYDAPDADDLATEARAAGYDQLELLRGLHQRSDSDAQTAIDALDHDVPMDVLVAYLRDELKVDAEELDRELDGDDIPFEDQIDLLYGLLHPPVTDAAPPSAEPAEAVTPTTEDEPAA